MEETRFRWIILITLAFMVIAITFIIPVVIASDYYQSSADRNKWTPISNENSTATQTIQSKLTESTSTTSSVPTKTVLVNKNCTYNAIYWMNHPESWPSQIIIGELNYTKDDAVLYIENPVRDRPIMLFIQLHATFLNLLSGADPESIEQTMIEASQWLSEHPIGSVVSKLDLHNGLVLVRILEDYNNGITGPGHCEDEPLVVFPTETPGLTITSGFETETMETPTPTITATRTRVPAITPRRTSTPTKTKKPGDSQPTQPPPTQAPTQQPPTQEPPTQPPPTQPPPTQPPPTQQPPTQPPPPTQQPPTQPPPPTSSADS